MLKSSSCDYSVAYIHGKRTMTVVGQGTYATSILDINNKQVIFKNCVPFTDYLS